MSAKQAPSEVRAAGEGGGAGARGHGGAGRHFPSGARRSWAGAGPVTTHNDFGDLSLVETRCRPNHTYIIRGFGALSCPCAASRAARPAMDGAAGTAWRHAAWLRAGADAPWVLLCVSRGWLRHAASVWTGRRWQSPRMCGAAPAAQAARAPTRTFLGSGA